MGGYDMTPHTPDNGGDSTPGMGTPVLFCPTCGAEIPPIAHPVGRLAALSRKPGPTTTTPFPRDQVDPKGDAETRIMRGQKPGDESGPHEIINLDSDLDPRP